MRNHSGLSCDVSYGELTAEQQHRLVKVLEDCLYRQQLHGKSFTDSCHRASILASNADLGVALTDALDGLLWVGNLKPPEPLTRLDAPEIKGFELLKEIGRGGMGVVYSARRIVDGSEVAIKVLVRSSSLSRNYLERFHREAKAASSVCHPSIVPVYEMNSDGDLCYLTMKHIDGESLAQRIRRQRSRLEPIHCVDTWRHLAKEFAGIAEGLHQVHLSGILHRDIKPSNVLIDGREHFWILDFGLASIADGETLTCSGDLVGTFRYMSPEQAAGRNELLDSRTDIYSLGLTLYEAVTWTSPFSQFEGAGLLKAVQTPMVEPPRRICSSIPKDLETIIMRAVRPDRNARYSSAQEFADDLERFANGEPIHARRVTWGEKASAWCRKHPDRVLVGMGSMIVATVAMGVHSTVVQRERDQTRIQWVRGNANYEQARAAVDTLGLRVSEQLANLPGTEALRREVLAETLKYYEAFIARSNQDPMLRRDVAETRWKMASLIGIAGSKADAIDALRLAVDDLYLAWRETEDSNSLLLAVQSKCELARLLGEQGEFASAQSALDLASTWTKDLPDGMDKAYTESLLWNSMAILAYKTGDARGASKLAIRAVERLDSYHEKSSAIDDRDINRFQVRIRTSIADALHNLGAILAEQGYVDVAQRVASRSLAMRTSGPTTPRTSDDLRRLALSYSGLASLAWKQGKIDEAIQTYSRSAELLEQAVDQLPGLLGPRRELAVTLNNLGMAQSSAQLFEVALKTFQKAIGIASSIADADSSNAEAAKHAAGIWNNLAMVQIKMGEARLASESMRKAIQYQQSVTQSESTSGRDAKLLQQYKSNLSSWAIEPVTPSVFGSQR
ncbi:protein kinase domain-containing protein [Pirellulaceae bacterium SH501]